MNYRTITSVPFLLGIAVLLFLLGGAVHSPPVSDKEIIKAKNRLFNAELTNIKTVKSEKAPSNHFTMKLIPAREEAMIKVRLS